MEGLGNLTVLQPKPDLVIATSTLNDAIVFPRDVLTASASEGNNGTATAGAHYLYYYLSTDNVLGTGDTKFAEDSIASLAVNTLSPQSATYAIPDLDRTISSNFGTRYVIFKADGTSAVDEKDETNNTAAQSFTITRPTIAQGSLNTYSAEPTNRLTVTFNICNPDNQTRTIGLGFSIRKTGTTTWINDTNDDGTKSVTSGCANYVRYFDIPAGTVAGTYDVAYGIHSGLPGTTTYLYDYVEEQSTLTMYPAKPDLQITTINTTPTSVYASESTTVSITIANYGSAGAASFNVDYLLSTDSTLDISDELLGSKSVASLAKSASTPVSKLITIPPHISKGGYYILVFVDSLGSIDESQENNNMSSIAVQIADQPFISGVELNHQDGRGANYATISSYTFMRGRDDYFAKIDAAQDLALSVLSNPRLGLWAEVSITNNGVKEVTGYVSGKIQYPGGHCPDTGCYDLPLPTYIGYLNSTAKANSIAKINFPLIPIKGDTGGQGEYQIFLKFKEEYDFSAPDAYITIDNNLISPPENVLAGQNVKWDPSNLNLRDETTITAIDYLKAVFGIIKTICAFRTGNTDCADIDLPGGFAGGRYNSLRVELYKSTDTDLQISENTNNITTIMTRWRDRAVSVAQDQGGYLNYSINYDRATSAIDINAGTSESYPQIISPPDLASRQINYTDAYGNKHTSVDWQSYFVDKGISTPLLNVWNELPIEIYHTTNIEIVFSTTLELGPYRGGPILDADGNVIGHNPDWAIIDYGKWHIAPDEVYWLGISASQSAAVASGFGIQDIYGVNQSYPGQIFVDVLAPSSGNYYVKAFDGSLAVPGWGLSPASSPLVQVNQGNHHIFSFSVSPDSNSKSFQFWLYRESFIPGIYFVVNKVSITMQPYSATIPYISYGPQDGWILESSETSNQGGSLNTIGNTLLVGDSVGNKQYRSILSFDTSNLPDNAVIVSAILKLRKQSLVGTNPFTTHQGLKFDIQKPYFGTTPSLVISDFQAGASMITAGGFSNVPVSNWYSASLNTTAKGFINKTGFTQFRIRFALDDNNDNGNDYIAFFSGNYVITSYRPVLLIQYYVP